VSERGSNVAWAARRLIGRSTGTSRGHVDRAHRGLITGWLYCPACLGGGTVVIRLGRSAQIKAPLAIERPDAPAGWGFATRFKFDQMATDAGVTVLVHCLHHPRVKIRRRVPAREWRIGALGQIEASTPERVSGWVCDLSSDVATATITFQGGRRAVVPLSVDRPDVAQQLGTCAARGFDINPLSAIGIQPDTGTKAQLSVAARRVALDVAILQTPLATSEHPEPTQRRPRWPNREPLVLRPHWQTRLRASSADETGLVATRTISPGRMLAHLAAANLMPDADPFALHPRLKTQDVSDEATDTYVLLDHFRTYPGLPVIPASLTGADVLVAHEPWRKTGLPTPTILQRLHATSSNNSLGPEMGEDAYTGWLVAFLDWLRPLAHGVERLTREQIDWLQGSSPPLDSTRYIACRLRSQMSDSFTVVQDEFLDGYGDLFVTRDGVKHALSRRVGNKRDKSGAGSASRSVIVAGLYGHPSGVGANVQASVSAVQMAGGHVQLIPLRADEARWKAQLVDGAPEGRDLRQHAVLLHLPMDTVPTTLAMQPALRTCSRLIGFFMWETTLLPDALVAGVDLMDEVWTATEFVKTSIQRTSDVICHVVGHAVDVTGCRPIDHAECGIRPDDYVVHYSFDAHSGVDRKHPLAAVQAFQKAFQGFRDVTLLFKVRNYQYLASRARSGDAYARDFLRSVEDDERIILITAELDRATTLGLIEMADCYLSLHRSEGFGYTMAEAMALRTPVIATGFSGNLDFMSSRESWLVGYRSVPV
jgi:hypothetical protein